MAVSPGNGVLGQRSLGNEHDQMYFMAMYNLSTCDDMVTFPFLTRLQCYLLENRGQWVVACYPVDFVHE